MKRAKKPRPRFAELDRLAAKGRYQEALDILARLDRELRTRLRAA